MKKKAVVLSSVAVIGVCASVIAGSTFALFTSEQSGSITATTANVAIEATLDNVSTESTLNEIEGISGVNAVATAAFGEGADANKLTITNMVPGDKISFDVTVKNNSSITVNYGTTFDPVSDNLKDVLTVTSSAAENASLAVGAEATYTITVALANTADNTYNVSGGLSTTVTFTVLAVQGNVTLAQYNTIEAAQA